jgi:hypothetical protein
MLSSTYDDWQRIVARDDQPVLRNLLITQGYHDLSIAFARMLGAENVTWFSFASWSSKVVGQFIQNRELPQLLQAWIEGAGTSDQRLARLNTQLQSLHDAASDANQAALDAAVRCAINDMRMYLAMGNTQVFGELAPVFGRFLQTFGNDSIADAGKLEQFLSALNGGPIEPDQIALDPQTRELKLIGRGGQTLLRDAARHYYEAKFETNPKRKAELILLANANIGLHEQTRLQTYIAGALDAPLDNVLINTTHDALAERFGDDVLGSRGYAVVDRLLSPITDHVQGVFHRFATELMMTLKLPDGTVRLGRDLPACPGQPLFPQALVQIQDPTLAALLAQYDALAERGQELDALRQIEDSAERLLAKLGLDQSIAIGTGAEDWVSLNQRMRFILELFRSRQQDVRLLEPTFTAEQVAEMLAGRIPAGPLT